MNSSQHQHLARSAGVFTGATLLSRILGYARDSLVANFFGAGIAADAFYAAFRISNLFRRLLGEGALSAAFVPVFSRIHAQESEEKTREFFSVIWTALFVVLATVTVLGILFAPELTRVIAMGFEKTPERFDLTVTLTRWMLPFLLFVSLAALVTGVLNSLKSFFLPALAPASLSVAEIAYLLAIAPHVPLERQIVGLAIAVSIGGLGQLLIQLPALRRKGFSLGFRWQPRHPGLRQTGTLMLPAMFGLSVDQLNAFVDTICASFLAPGSVTALYYSNRVMQLPLALFGIALSQVSLPAMSASVARGDVDDVKSTLNFALRLTLFMILPATTGLMLLGRPIVAVLFEHGQFSPQATALTTHALFFFAIGLLAYSAVKILASAFYAFQNTRVPVQWAALSVALNAVLSILLMKPMGVGGLALATASASWVNAIGLYVLLRQKLGPLGGGTIARSAVKSLLACAAMGIFCRLVMAGEGRAPLWVLLAISIAGGAAVYLGTARLLRMSEWGPFWAQLQRRRRPAA